MKYLIEDLEMVLPWGDGKLRKLNIQTCPIEFVDEFDGEMDGSEFVFDEDQEVDLNVEFPDFDCQYHINPASHIHSHHQLILGMIKKHIIENYDFSHALERWHILQDGDYVEIKYQDIRYQVPKAYVDYNLLKSGGKDE